MTTILSALFDPAALTPHGFCLLWEPGLIWLQATSDALIGLAYFSIPVVLLRFVRRRPDLDFGWILWLFAGFILACGSTHFMSILTLWEPLYWLEGLVKLATAGSFSGDGGPCFGPCCHARWSGRRRRCSNG